MFSRIERATTLAEATYAVMRSEGSSRLHAFLTALEVGRRILDAKI